MTELAHAILSASGAKKWTTCTMAAAMEKGMPDEISAYNREGTYAHAVAESRLRAFLGAPLNTLLVDKDKCPDAREFFNDEFDEYVQDYVEFVQQKITELRQQHGDANVVVLLEQRLRFDKWVPEGFGTGDVVIIVPKKIHVIDLKFGQGVWVDGEDNEQLKLYGLGAWDTYDTLYDFDEVEVWIHQPRKGNVSGETIDVHHVTGLLTWAEHYIKPRAAIAWAAYNGDRTEARFHPGVHCNEGFCKARYTCAARARYNLELGDLPHALNEPDKLTVEQLEQIVSKGATVAKWVSDVESFLLKQVLDGKAKLTKFRLGEGRSFRRIEDEPAAAAALEMEGFDASDIYRPRALVTLGALERLVGAKKLVEVLGDLLKKPPGKAILVPLSDKPAAPIAPKRTPEQDFADD